MASPRSITFVLRGDFPEGNAGNSRVKAYAKTLKEAGHRVELIYMWASGFNHQKINTEASGFWQDIPFRYVNRSPYRPAKAWGKLWDTLKGMTRAAWHVWKNRKNTDLIFAYCPDTHYYLPVYIASKLAGIPVLIEQTELKSSLYLEDYKKKNLFYYLNRWDEGHTQWFAQHMMVISQHLKSHYARFFPNENLHLVPIIVDEDRFEKIPDIATKYTIGYVGSFGVKDGVNGILNAFQQAAEQIPQLRLHLMGYCDHQQRLQQWVDERGLTDRVWFSGAISFHAIPDLLAQCDTLVINRINSIYANHGFPTKLGEYLATGRPVILTQVGDVADYLTHEKEVWMIPPENDNALANAILQRYTRENEFAAMGAAGKAHGLALFGRHALVKNICAVFEAASGLG